MSKKYLAGNFQTKSKGERVIIRGLANKAIVDRGNDFVEPTAFSNGGLDNYKDNPMILFNHNPDIPIGKALKVTPSDDGLIVEVEVSDSDDELTKRIRNNIKQGILRTFSIGFETKDEEENTEKGVTHIKEAELFEVSVVSIPMNQGSTFDLLQKASHSKALCVKSLQQAEMEVDIDEEDEEEKATKILKVGKTGEANDHSHDVEVEMESGNGVTTSVLSDEDGGTHKHEILNGVVQEAEGHVHSLDLDSLAEPEGEGGDESADEERTDKQESIEEEAAEDAEPSEEEKAEDALSVQSLIFSKESFDSESALTWAKDHNFKSESAEDGGDSIRIGQRDKQDFVEDTFKTVALTDGVSAVMGKLKEAPVEEETDAKSLQTLNALRGLYKLQEFFEAKQAEQEDVVAVSVPLDNAGPDKDFGSPQLETAMQTNVLLGQVIGELQKLAAQVAQMGTQAIEEEEKVNKEPETNLDDLSDTGLTDKLTNEESSTAKSLVTSGTKYLNRLDERLRLLGV